MSCHACFSLPSSVCSVWLFVRLFVMAMAVQWMLKGSWGSMLEDDAGILGSSCDRSYLLFWACSSVGFCIYWVSATLFSGFKKKKKRDISTL
ncbi:hypothetical protein GGR50DRAFT_684034, partial [Xylaria sp. CBS 124048]